MTDTDELLRILSDPCRHQWSGAMVAATCEKSIAAIRSLRAQLTQSQADLAKERGTREAFDRELFIQTEAAKCLGRVVADKDADRIFFRDKASAAEARHCVRDKPTGI